MKVENHEGKGNPYHEDETGQFTSAEESGAKSENQESEQIDNDLLDFANSFSKGAVSDISGEEVLNLFEEEDSLDSLLDNADDDSDLFKALDREIVISEEIKNMSEEELKEVVTNVSSIAFNLDPRKLEELSIEELREIQQCCVDLDAAKHNKELIALSEEKFEGLWPYAVSPEDYEEYSKPKNDGLSRIEKKRAWYLENTEGEKQEQKLALLDKFEADCKKYQELKAKLDKESFYSSLIIDRYKNENDLYSQERKNNAVWIKNGGQAETSKLYEQRGDELWDYLEEYFPKGAAYIYDYTGSYSGINNPLRKMAYPHKEFKEQTEQKKKSFAQRVTKMTEALDQCTNGFDCWVQRYTDQIFITSGDFMLDYSITNAQLKNLEGVVYKDEGFMSCGTAKGTGLGSGKSMVMNIYCPRGIKMLYVAPHSQFHSENETIINRGYDYKITKAYKQNGKIYLDVECILGSDSTRLNDDQLLKAAELYF